MNGSISPDVVVTLCRNCIPEGSMLPRQWFHEGIHVLVREMPCSGKTDMTYIFRALEGGATGCCVVTCAKGDCKLSQGNYRAMLRVETTKRLIAEAGLDPEQIQIMECPKDLSAEEFEHRIGEKVERIASLRDSTAPRPSLQDEVQEPWQQKEQDFRHASKATTPSFSQSLSPQEELTQVGSEST